MYSSKEEIQSAIKDMKLKEYIQNRADYAKLSGKNLVEWVIFKKYILRANGSLWMTDSLKNDENLDNILILQNLFEVFNEYKSVSMHPVNLNEIPSDIDNCELCGKKWNYNNIDDFYLNKNYNNDTVTRYHIKCFSIKSKLDSRKYYNDLLKLAGIEAPLLVEIPNEYFKNDFDSWFNLILPECDIKMGWRKRVINLEIHNYTNKNLMIEQQLDLSEIFKDENVTKSYSYIHAWSDEKAVSYLKTILEELKKLPEKPGYEI